MLDTEKAGAQTPPLSDPQEWTEILNSIKSFIEFRCKDQGKGYLELKEFAERQLARLGATGKTPVDLKDEITPKRPENLTTLETDRSIRSNALDDLLVAVVAD